MSEGTLYDHVWNEHLVETLPTGQDQLFVGLHLIHEVTSPQAFGMLRERDLEVAFPERTHATVDHVIPTKDRSRPLEDDAAEEMLAALETNTSETGITYSGPETGDQGIAHVVGPEQGLTQPGMTIVCGDSHTATHGAFGALAFGIGTSQIRDVLATGSVAAEKHDVRRIEITGELSEAATVKDLVLGLIRELGTDGGVGYVYEYGGPVVEAMSMEERMTLANMSIEGGATAGYINPDETTYEYLQGRDAVPEGEAFEERKAYWESIRSNPDAIYDDVVEFDASQIEPSVTWGITPGQVVGVTEPIPAPADLPAGQRDAAERAYEHMDVSPGETMDGYGVDVVFLGSCTNGRLPDLRAAAEVLEGHEVDPDVEALAVPGSQRVKAAAEAEGLDSVFREAGFEWRDAGCSMCLGMNGDRLEDGQVSASSTNRNFVGRQGSKDGRTILMSPEMVAAAAIEGEVTDVRTLDQ
ncbi:3-isopropylmalate dehydratase large subunit [Halodesulfurarchaeum sp. HSR-GB]|uniref:3-isopropylmalate dehydratase large subunit n=1 Tax=Halodesulfurarchaeum sp. HSR-GB TaxID=3074077 RepID=UPI0028549656|nr:3-isopropylmalate dehydratase large subunit [Halodesulfurarchaeum sp. HSR-GB]MDR5655794.1 3-isopropylmalate dehydratase large subunit [Halodesulfurarchaeum sp. HSR-GB]